MEAAVSRRSVAVVVTLDMEIQGPRPGCFSSQAGVHHAFNSCLAKSFDALVGTCPSQRDGITAGPQPCRDFDDTPGESQPWTRSVRLGPANRRHWVREHCVADVALASGLKDLERLANGVNFRSKDLLVVAEVVAPPCPRRWHPPWL